MVAALAVIAVAMMVIDTSEARDFTAGGLGIASCAAWTSARRDREARSYEQWILGFLSGIGYESGDEGDNPLGGTDADGIWTWMDDYCQAHPREEIVDASKAFNQAHPR